MKTRNKGILWSYVYIAVNMVCGLFLSSFLIRTLGDTEYGIYQTISSFANCLVMLEFGTGTVLTKNIVLCRSRNASEEEINRNISTIWVITLALSAVICAAAIALYLGIDFIYAKSMTAEQIAYAKRIFIVTFVYLLASFLFQTARSTALGFENYTFSSKINLVRVISRSALIVLLISLSKSAIYIALIDACLSVVLLIFTLIFCKVKLRVKFRFSYFEAEIFRDCAKLCLSLFIQTVVNQINVNVDKFLIGAYEGPELVSLYGIGMYVYTVFSSITTVPITMFAPQIISEVGLNGISKELHSKILQAGKLVTVIGGSIFFGFIACGRHFIDVLYGEKYMMAWLIAVILMSSAFLNMITGALVNVLDALNKRMFRSVLIFTTTVLNVILTIWWLPDYGIIGAAVATAICTILGQVIVMGIYYTVNLKFKVLKVYFKTFKDIIIYQIISMAVSAVASKGFDSAIAGLIIGMGIYIAVFAVLYAAFSKDGRVLAGKFLKKEKIL